MSGLFSLFKRCYRPTYLHKVQQNELRHIANHTTNQLPPVEPI